MKSILILSAMGVALASAGCARTVESAATTGRLDCPAKEGDLTRISVAEDGRSCLYRAADGADVELRLVPVNTDAYATLAELERELEVRSAGAPDQADAAGQAASAPAQQASQETAALARQVEAQARADAAAGAPAADEERAAPSGDEDQVSIDLPGFKIEARDEDAQIKIGPVNIDAGDGGATVKVARDVRLKGEALSREKRGVRATFILAGERAPSGYGYIGYEAAGPKKGPLAVAIVTSTREPENSGIDDAISDLVRRNGGV